MSFSSSAGEDGTVDQVFFERTGAGASWGIRRLRVRSKDMFWSSNAVAGWPRS